MKKLLTAIIFATLFAVFTVQAFATQGTVSVAETVLADGVYYLVNNTDPSKSVLTTDGASAENYNVLLSGSVLTLNNANIVGNVATLLGEPGNVTPNLNKTFFYSAIDELTLHLLGSNSVVNNYVEDSDPSIIDIGHGITSEGSITIEGDGQLEVKATHAPLTTMGNLTIKSGNIIATTGSESGSTAIYSNKDLVITGGNVKAHGHTVGISVGKEFTMQGGFVEAVSQGRIGLSLGELGYGGIHNISGGTLKVSAPGDSSGTSKAITCLASNFNVSGGNVYVDGGLSADNMQITGGEFVSVDKNIGIVLRGVLGVVGGTVSSTATESGGSAFAFTLDNNPPPQFDETSGVVHEVVAGANADSASAVSAPTMDTFTQNGYIKVSSGYKIYVAGVRVTPGNAHDVLGDGTVKYDNVTETLTFTNANISADNPGGAVVDITEDNVTLVMHGNNSITNTNAGQKNSDAIRTVSPLTIKTEGSFTATSGTVESNAVNGKVFLDGGKLSFKGSMAAFSETPTVSPIYGFLPQLIGNDDYTGTDIFLSFPGANNALSTLPSGSTVVLTPLTAEKMTAMTKYTSDNNVSGSTLFMVDIKLVDAEGIEVQPSAETRIRVDIPGVQAGGTVKIVHELTAADGTVSVEILNPVEVGDGYVIIATKALSPFSFVYTPPHSPAISPLTGVYTV